MNRYTYGGWRGRVGYIGPCPGEHELMEFYQIAPPGVSLVATGLSVQGIDAKNLNAALAQPLVTAIRDMVNYDVSCIVLAGEPMVFLNGYGSEERLNKVAAEITPCPFTHNLPCAVGALRYLGVKKLALATPYSVRDLEGRDVTRERWESYLTKAGFDVVAFGTLALSTNRDLARLPIDAPYKFARKVVAEAKTPPDGVYLPCSAWRAPIHVAPLEADLGIPVVCSVQAWTWRALQMIGVREARPGFGKLFQEWKMSE